MLLQRPSTGDAQPPGPSRLPQAPGFEEEVDALGLFQAPKIEEIPSGAYWLAGIGGPGWPHRYLPSVEANGT